MSEPRSNSVTSPQRRPHQALKSTRALNRSGSMAAASLAEFGHWPELPAPACGAVLHRPVDHARVRQAIRPSLTAVGTDPVQQAVGVGAVGRLVDERGRVPAAHRRGGSGAERHRPEGWVDVLIEQRLVVHSGALFDVAMLKPCGTVVGKRDGLGFALGIACRWRAPAVAFDQPALVGEPALRPA